MRQVSRTTFDALKNVKFRLSRNSTKFNVVARFRETIPTVKSVLSSEIKKFLTDFDRNYHFTILSKIRIFRSFTEIERRKKSEKRKESERKKNLKVNNEK